LIILADETTEKQTNMNNGKMSNEVRKVVFHFKIG